MKIAVLASGSGTNLQALIDQLHHDENSGVEIAVVMSDRRKAYALTRAKEAGIPTHVVRVRDFPNRDAFDAKISEILDRCEVELIVLAGFMKLFQPTFVRKYRNRIINIHPSLLPAFPGAHSVPDTLAYGAKVSGITVFLLMKELTLDLSSHKLRCLYSTMMMKKACSSRIHIEEHKLYPQVVRWYAAGKLEVVGRKVVVKES